MKWEEAEPFQFGNLSRSLLQVTGSRLQVGCGASSEAAASNRQPATKLKVVLAPATRTSETGRKGGHTLAEVMVSVGLLGIMVVSLFAGFSSGFDVVRAERENVRATQILEERMEVIRLIHWDYVAPGFIPTNFTVPFYAAAGSSAIFTSSAFERRFRDIHTVTQQLQGRQAHLETVGRYLLGLEPDQTFL